MQTQAQPNIATRVRPGPKPRPAADLQRKWSIREFLALHAGGTH